MDYRHKAQVVVEVRELRSTLREANKSWKCRGPLEEPYNAPSAVG